MQFFDQNEEEPVSPTKPPAPTPQYLVTLRPKKKKTLRPTSTLALFKTAPIPYFRGTSQTIAHILQPYNIRVAHKLITTLRRLLTNVKDKDKPQDRQGAVYKIKCPDCQGSRMQLWIVNHNKMYRNRQY